MNSELSHMQELLFDYALDRLDETTRAEVDCRLASDPAWAAQLQRIRRMLDPLSTWTAPDPPARFVNGILDRIEAAGRFRVLPASTLPPNERRMGGGRPIISLPELVALAACIMLFVGVFVPSMSHSRYMAQRSQCQANLASIFGGLSQYAGQFDGQFPSIGPRPGVNWLREQPNTQNLQPMIQAGFVTPNVLVCPSQGKPGARQDRRAGTLVICRYSVQHQGGSGLRLGGRVCIPIVADENPLFVGRQFHKLPNPLEANSPAHRGTGQNVLLSNGRVVWIALPVYDPYRDNIYTAGEATVYEGTEAPVSATDAFLVP